MHAVNGPRDLLALKLRKERLLKNGHASEIWSIRLPADGAKPAFPPAQTMASGKSLHKKGVYEKNVMPMIMTSVIIGLIPLTLERYPKISWNPLRSTFIWCLFVNACYICSAYSGIQSQLRLVKTPDTSDECRFMALMSVVALFNIFLTPLGWIELHICMKKGTETFRKLEDLVQWESSKFTKLVSWSFAQLVFLWIPLFVCAALVTLPEWASAVHWTHFPAYWISVTLLINSPAYIIGRFTSMRVNAVMMARQFGKELHSGALSVRRVRFHRRAWLLLRALTEQGIGVPYAALVCLVQTIVLFVMAAYQVALFLGNGAFSNALVIASVFVTLLGTLFLMSHVVQQASEAVVQCYLKPLNLRKYVTFYDWSTLHEINQLHELIVTKKIEVSFAGFCGARRQLVGSVVTTSVTYLVVLYQFQ